MPSRMIIEMVYASNFWLNCFPRQDSASDTLSPRTIITGMHIDFTKHCRAEFGTYAQVHEDHDNSMSTRTTGAIALRPTGNTQGGYYFYSLTTGRRLNRNHWTALPMPADVINRVHTLARRSGATLGLTFFDRLGNLIVDLDGNNTNDSDDEDYDPDGQSSYSDDDDTTLSGNNHDDFDIESTTENNFPPDANIEGVDPATDHEMANSNTDVNADIRTDVNSETDTNNENNFDDDDDVAMKTEEDTTIINEDDVEEDLATQMDTKYGPRKSRHNLRSRKATRQPRDYNNLMDTTLESTVMTQHSMKKGIQLYGEAGVEAVLDELQQLHDRKVIAPKSNASMSRSDKLGSLQYLMFLKKKRCGRIKGRGCADGRKQRAYTDKADASAPTVSI